LVCGSPAGPLYHVMVDQLQWEVAMSLTGRVLVCVCVLFLICPISALDVFDPGLVESNPDKVFKEYILTQPETDTKRFKGAKKVIMPQFHVGFVTSRKGKFETSGLTIEGKAKLAGLDEAGYQALTDKILDVFIEAYRAGGYEVIPPADIVANPQWSKWVKKSEARPKAEEIDREGTTMKTYVPSVFKNQYPTELVHHEMLKHYTDTIVGSGGVMLEFLRFDGKHELVGAAGSLTFEPFLQVGASMGYVTVQKYRFGMYAGTFKKPLIFSDVVGTVEQVEKKEIKEKKRNIVNVSYHYNLDAEKMETSVLNAARIAANISVKNLQRVTNK
jgi:hypothetical protein